MIVNCNQLIFSSILFSACAGSAYAEKSQVVIAKSSLAVVTDKEGVASGLAHRHIVVAREWTASLNLIGNPDGVKASVLPWIGGSAEIEIPVKKLLADDAAGAEPIKNLLIEHGIWSATNDHLEPSNQAKVTENMLDESQLNSEAFPKISGSGSFDACQNTAPGVEICKLKLSVTIRGKTITKQIDLTLNLDPSGTTANFMTPIKFTEFGITPYSAMLGAIRVSDQFRLAGSLRAE